MSRELSRMIDAAVQIAAIMAAYHKGLLDNGVEEEDAIALTVAYQGELLRPRKVEFGSNLIES